MKKIDLTEKRYGRYLVLEKAGRDKQGSVLWKCLCDCGIAKIVRAGNLRSGNTKSCGCLQREKISDRSKINLTGQCFDRLVVLKEVGKSNNGHILWKCQCGCGNEIVVCSSSLRSGDTKSCGCLRDEKLIEQNRQGHSEETKQKISRAMIEGEFVKGEKNPNFGKDFSGSNGPNYNPDITDEERQHGRFYPEYKEWHTAVFERDDYTCQCCGKRGCKLNAHHLESYRDNPELRTLLENGITLCEERHKNFHHQYGYGNTRAQFEEFLRTQTKLEEIGLKEKESIKW